MRPPKPGARVTIQTVGGEPFDAEKLYTIATNDFTAAGGDTYYAFRYANQSTGYKTGLALEDAPGELRSRGAGRDHRRTVC